jgi:septal ring-binding cell division protein DamX
LATDRAAVRSAKSAVSGSSKPGLHGDIQRIAPDSLTAAEWLDSQNPAHYTIQLSSSRREQSARDFIRRHYLDSGARYAPVESKGATWYAVFYGAYSSREAAMEVVAALPADLQAGEPWVRSIDTVQAQVAGSHKHWAKLESGLLPADRDPRTLR